MHASPPLFALLGTLHSTFQQYPTMPCLEVVSSEEHLVLAVQQQV